MKLIKKTLLVTTMILAACSKNSGSNTSSSPASEQAKTANTVETTTSNTYEDQLEDALLSNSYENMGADSKVTKYSTFYKATLSLAENSPKDEVNLSMSISFQHDKKLSFIQVPLDFNKGVRLFTKGSSVDFFDDPQKFDRAPIFAEEVGHPESKVKIGEFLLTENGVLDYKMCEKEYASICEATLDLKSPKKGSNLERDLMNHPRFNPLDLFPYQAEFKILLKQNKTANVYFFYDIKNELK